MGNIVDIKKPEKWRDASATLRHVADQIDKGEFGNVRLGIMSLLEHDTGSVVNFGFGPDADDMQVVALFSLANHAILRDIVED